MEYIAPAIANGIASEQEALAAYNASMHNYTTAHPDGGTPEQWEEFNNTWHSYEYSIRGRDGYEPIQQQSGYRPQPSQPPVEQPTYSSSRPQNPKPDDTTFEEFENMQNEYDPTSTNVHIPTDIIANQFGDKILLGLTGAAIATGVISGMKYTSRDPFLPVDKRPPPVAEPAPTPKPPTSVVTTVPVAPGSVVPTVKIPTISDLTANIADYWQTSRRKRRVREL